MKRFLNYLKPFWLVIILIVGLTYSQVQCELALPDYMSNIVTNGIQYGGVKDSTPLAIRSSELDKMLLFMDDDEKNKVLDSYTLVKDGNEARIANQLVKFNEDIYVLNEKHDNLNEIFINPIVYVGIIDNEKTLDADSIYSQISENSLMKSQIMQKIDAETAGYAANLSSAAIIYLQGEYKNVGLNIELLQTNYILYMGFVMLGVSLLGIVCQIISTYLATKVSAKVAYKIRQDVFKRVETFSSTEFSHFSTSSLITRTTNDITQIQQLVQMCLRIVLMAPMMGITSVFKVLRYPDLLWILLTALGLIILAMIATLVIALPKFKSIQGLIDKMNSVMREFLDGMLVIRAFNAEKHEEKRFDDSNKILSKTILFVDRTMSITMPFMMFLMNAITVAIIWFGSKQIDINALSVGEMMAFIQYAMHVLMSFMIVAMIWVMIPRSIVSVKRVFEVLDTKDTILDKDKAVSMPKENADLVFDNVTFTYPNAQEATIEDISFVAHPGETVAFIGSTGSGKSTLIKLIPRLFDVTRGSIKYGGIDLRDLKQTELRDSIGFVPQKAVLFKGNIETNIAFGHEISDESLNNAIEVSQSRNIIDEKENGIKYEIAQGGSNLSGGQKQRLSIARALAKKAKLYIFDDSFSALDYHTDKMLRAKLSEMIKKEKSTVFIVAQRISTIKNADKIIVLDDGKIVGMGKHSDLLKTCKVYQEIAKSQLSEEELKNA